MPHSLFHECAKNCLIVLPQLPENDGSPLFQLGAPSLLCFFLISDANLHIHCLDTPIAMYGYCNWDLRSHRKWIYGFLTVSLTYEVFFLQIMQTYGSTFGLRVFSGCFWDARVCRCFGFDDSVSANFSFLSLSLTILRTSALLIFEMSPYNKY